MKYLTIYWFSLAKTLEIWVNDVNFKRINTLYIFRNNVYWLKVSVYYLDNVRIAVNTRRRGWSMLGSWETENYRILHDEINWRIPYIELFVLGNLNLLLLFITKIVFPVVLSFNI
jgi:hypothetical protein